MDLILRNDVRGVGRRGDLVTVADGYARNYLIPKGWAFKATSGVHAQADAMRRKREVADASARSAAEDVAKTLVGRTITVSAKTSSGERLFGSVTPVEVVAAITEQTGLELDPHDLGSDEPIRTTGVHEVHAKLHADVEFSVTVEVV
ncbi:MAG TPA: 50S ribosomal protein L9, partial [Acidimicrobiales bacterium]|nr:50S ribosomal protein L9 [Acidimicrobiales bacterium]